MAKPPLSRSQAKSSSPSPALTLQELQARTAQHPEDAAAWKALGQHLLDAGELEAARSAVQQAGSLAENDADACLLLARIELKDNQNADALRLFRHALVMRPDCADAMLGVATVLAGQEDNEEALDHLEGVLAQQPKHLAALLLQTRTLTKLARFDEAVAVCETLVRLDPRNAPVYLIDLGNIKRDLSQFEEAEAYYRRAATLSPTFRASALSNLLTLLHYMPTKSAEDILAVCKEWGALYSRKDVVKRPRPGDRSAHRVIRIGMFSDGFRQHPVGAMTLTALEQLRRYGIEIYAYSSNAIVDAMTQRMIKLSQKWLPIAGMTDVAFANQLLEDGIDILVDLSGHNAGTRMPTIAMEPAPIIIKWVGGLINTTGAKAFDYLITDSIESPPGSDAMYTEKLIRMPDDYICYVPPSRVPDVGPLPATRNGYVTFGCFNNPTKLNDVLLTQWAGLMLAVPESRLFLKSGPLSDPARQKYILDLMAGHGIASDRIRMEGRSNHYQLFECYNEIDIALDPWPYSGGLTTCEAMLMGVPVVTLPGPTFAGRHSATHVANVGMPELIASDWSEYQARAVELATNLDVLGTIRGQLRKTLLDSPVCDGAKFGRHLADALRAVWTRYCDGKPSAALAFTAEGQPWFEDDTAPTVVQHPEFQDDSFSFSFKGKIVTLDHGGSMTQSEQFSALSQLRTLAMVTFDPAGNVKAADRLQASGHLEHYQTQAVLGDGQPAILHACLDATLSGTLEPLPAERQLPFLRQGSNVLARLPLPSVRLDNIDGLQRIDWLILDERHDNREILLGGQRLLADVLVIQARVLFTDVYANQPDLISLGAAIAPLGLRLLQLDRSDYRSYFPSDLKLQKAFHGSQLYSANAVFIPNDARLQSLDENRRLKLAFLLHAVYGATDLAHQVLGMDSGSTATRFLESDGFLKPSSPSGARVSVVGVSLHNVVTREQAAPVARLAQDIASYKPAEIDALVARCLNALAQDDANNTAHFLLAHALRAKGPLVDPDTPLLAALDERLRAIGWHDKGTLYAHWLRDVQYLKPIERPRISAILIANRFKPEIVDNVRALLKQRDDIEVVFVNNGAPQEDFSKLRPLVHTWIDLNRNSGAYLARNIGAAHAAASILLFVDDDGLPEAHFVNGHLEGHAEFEPACLRGACEPITRGSERPPHYNLGDTAHASPPLLEGNVSFNRQAFLEVGGWADYILFGHGGYDISSRLLRRGISPLRQMYTPASVLRHNYVRGDAHRKEKSAKQLASWRLLDALGTTDLSSALPIWQRREKPALQDPANANPVLPALVKARLGQPLALIGVPMHNEAAYVAETIRSLRAQDIDNVRFLIADNGSTDQTLEIVSDIAQGDDRFEIFRHKKNIGSLNNFRFLLEETESKYFMWLGGHDYLHGKYLSAMIETLERNNDISMACGTPYSVTGDTVVALEGAVYDFSQDTPLKRYLESVSRISNCTVLHSLFRREHVKDFEVRETVGWDHVLISHLLWKGTLAYLPDARYMRRYFPERKGSSAQRLTVDQRVLPYSDFFQYYVDDLRRLGAGLYAGQELEDAIATVRAMLQKRYPQKPASK